MGKNKSVWFNQDNHDYVEEEAKKDNVKFNKKVNQVISEKRQKAKKDEV